LWRKQAIRRPVPAALSFVTIDAAGDGLEWKSQHRIIDAENRDIAVLESGYVSMGFGQGRRVLKS